MDRHRAITVKTQVRRLRYFQVMARSLRKSGYPVDVLQRATTSWAHDHLNELHSYSAPSGEIRASSTEKTSQSFSFYFAAMVRLGLAHSISGQATNSRLGTVLKHLPGTTTALSQNSFALTSSERAFFLYVLLEADADYLLTVFHHVAIDPNHYLRYYQSGFQKCYLERLNAKLVISTESKTSGFLRDALQRTHEWRKPERYSEDIVPTRLNWLIDLGLVQADNQTGKSAKYSLTRAGFSVRGCMTEGLTYDDFSDAWPGKGYAECCASFLDIVPKRWEDLNDKIRTELFQECIHQCRKFFGSSLLPRLAAEQTFLYSVLYLLIGRAVVVEIATLEEWIGYDRNLGNMKIGYRKSARAYESYLAISNVQA